MSDSNLQSELHALTSAIEQVAANDLRRETEWRRLARISSFCGILSALAGAGFTIADRAVEKTSTNVVFHDQLIMMGIILMLMSIPLVLLDKVLRAGSKQRC